MDVTEAFRQLAVAVGLGLLVGLQRERAAVRLAGIRTFALVTLLGTLTAQLTPALGAWVVAAALLGLAALIVGGNLLKLRDGDGPVDPGQTTEVAMLVMFGVGAFVVLGSTAVAVAVGGGVAVLLHLKPQMHGLARRIGEDDFRAMMQFALISLVILPALPDRTFGPYQVLNPRQIWLMVVLVVGMGLAGYVAYKLLGQRRGALVAGVLGGLVSSTATTVAYARRSREEAAASAAAAVVVVLAAGTVFVRVLFEIAVVAPGFFRVAAGRLLPLLGLFALAAALFWIRRDDAGAPLPPQENPTQLRPALLFGLAYAVVLLAAAVARERFGGGGLFVVAALSGLTDVDAITLSTCQMVNTARVEPDDAWRLILVATLANLLFKGAAIAALGHRRLLVPVAGAFAAALALGGLLLALS
jgi:uncharacterized membrane protein (DUF4010 family)